MAEDGTMAGGPMYYIRYGLKNEKFARFLGASFAVCGAGAALLGTGNMAQSNSMALAFKANLEFPRFSVDCFLLSWWESSSSEGLNALVPWRNVWSHR